MSDNDTYILYNSIYLDKNLEMINPIDVPNTTNDPKSEKLINIINNLNINNVSTESVETKKIEIKDVKEFLTNNEDKNYQNATYENYFNNDKNKSEKIVSEGKLLPIIKFFKKGDSCCLYVVMIFLDDNSTDNEQFVNKNVKTLDLSATNKYNILSITKIIDKNTINILIQNILTSSLYLNNTKGIDNIIDKTIDNPITNNSDEKKNNIIKLDNVVEKTINQSAGSSIYDKEAHAGLMGAHDDSITIKDDDIEFDRNFLFTILILKFAGFFVKLGNETEGIKTFGEGIRLFIISIPAGCLAFCTLPLDILKTVVIEPPINICYKTFIKNTNYRQILYNSLVNLKSSLGILKTKFLNLKSSLGKFRRNMIGFGGKTNRKHLKKSNKNVKKHKSKNSKKRKNKKHTSKYLIPR